MKPEKYWQKRSEQIALRQFNKADQYSADLLKEYQAAIQSIQKDIEVFYLRYAEENEVSMAVAKRVLNRKELKDFRLSLEEFITKAKNNADGRWTKQLNTAYYRTRISRFEALQMQIRQQVEMLTASRQQDAEDLLGDVYKDTYYRTLFELQKGTGLGTSFAKIDDQGLQKVLGTEFAGGNWSKRIWGDRDKLTGEIYTKLSQSFIRGDDVHKTAKDIAQRMDVSYSNAKRLVQTETAFFVEQGTMEGYRQSGIVSRYEFLATLDMKTSDICREMDGKVFKVSEQEVGVNCPPLHAHCRSTTVPYFEDEEDPGERIARDPESGQTYMVPGNTTYEDWYQEHVIEKYGKAQVDIMRKKADNESSDWEQYNRYKKILGNDAPKTFESFQNLKYTEAEKWSVLKGDYRKLNAYQKIITNEPAITKDLKEVAEAAKTELVGLEYRLKSKESYLRKVDFDSKNSLDSKVIDETISNTNDVIRYTYQAAYDELVDKYNTINKKLSEKGYTQIKLKNYWLIKSSPYKGINSNYQSPDGQKFEIQYHTPESFELKNGEMHQLYEKWRLIKNKSDPEAIALAKKMSELSAKLKYPDRISEVR